MPRNTTVHRMYEHLLSAGYDEASAAKIAQQRTGLALATGRPPMHKKGEYHGQKIGRKSR